MSRTTVQPVPLLSRRTALLGLLLPLAACTGGGESGNGSDAPADDSAAGGGVTVADPWVKAALHERGCSAGLNPPASSSDRAM